MTEPPGIYVVGTCDTKGAELQYAADLLLQAGTRPVIVDVSTTPSDFAAQFRPAEVAKFHPKGVDSVLGCSDRGKAVTAMADAVALFMVSREDVAGVLGMGGSGNSTLASAAMRALPIGIPKMLVSTLASGNVASYVGASDVTIMHSVADIAGLNAITRKVIGNAAHAIAGMALNPVLSAAQLRQSVGLTMFGVTTDCVDRVRKELKRDFECFVFHATGMGGQCFENLIDSGLLSSAIDITTTEVADYLVGGILPCTSDRFGAIIRTRIPYVGSLGALDMVNFGARQSVPERFSGRKFHVHNASVTLMRTTAAENTAIAKWIVDRLNQMNGPVRFLLPLGGVSAIDAAGQPFHDPQADAALFDAVRKGWKEAPNRKLVEVDAHINSAAFASALTRAFKDIV